jgi:hypothetical protein
MADYEMPDGSLLQAALHAAQRINLPKPLPPVGALAALLVVEGVLDLDDAANVARVASAALVHEAEAWAYAAEVNDPTDDS